jgi:hypothetical protein
MRILITNNAFSKRTGSELYAKEVSEELKKRGHSVAVFSTDIGGLAQEMIKDGIEVVDDLAKLSWVPDIIHAQHHLETMIALSYFPDVPAIYICHGWRPWQEAPPLHPRIMEYAAVDLLTLDHAINNSNVPKEMIRLIHNFADCGRFKRRMPLPDKPKKALVFSNYASEENYLPLVRQACSREDIKLDAIGYLSGNQTGVPENFLGNYDIVFAVGRSAFEALVTGATVVICGDQGVGPMVSCKNMKRLYDFNFGTGAMYSKPDAEVIHQEICLYDADDSARLTDKLREIIDIAPAIGILESFYGEAIDKHKNKKINPEDEARAFSNYLRVIAINLKSKYQEIGGSPSAAQQKNQEIEWMKSSKFWKLREKYLSFKKGLGLGNR